ncbi:hypothetical protein PoB_005856400 [Plakobranchus ocellatus]|uniref:Uncharacterized protein n=1 Tax=Plakobranchus ocellatus TaxID=259542 RepID=A0AAV4CH35_9GAST|nr:hypothetical protein PoB_005856400 [Plakobranchus ocellatus]
MKSSGTFLLLVRNGADYQCLSQIRALYRDSDTHKHLSMRRSNQNITHETSLHTWRKTYVRRRFSLDLFHRATMSKVLIVFGMQHSTRRPTLEATRLAIADKTD